MGEKNGSTDIPVKFFNFEYTDKNACAAGKFCNYFMDENCMKILS